VGGSTQEHYHSRTEEIYFITAGKGRMRVERGWREVKAGDAIAIPPGKDKLWEHRKRNAEVALLLRTCL
jgi:quercetin dioxygenase-like cupin family protein